MPPKTTTKKTTAKKTTAKKRMTTDDGLKYETLGDVMCWLMRYAVHEELGAISFFARTALNSLDRVQEALIADRALIEGRFPPPPPRRAVNDARAEDLYGLTPGMTQELFQILINGHTSTGRTDGRRSPADPSLGGKLLEWKS